MLTCGHCFCNECIAIIIEQYSVGTRRSSIKCAICRQTTSHKEISYVFTAETANNEDDMPVKVSCFMKEYFLYSPEANGICLLSPNRGYLPFSTVKITLQAGGCISKPS